MLIIVTSLIMEVSILLSAFVSFSPNIHRLVEKNFMRSGRDNNTTFYCLKYGDLLVRAGKLAPGNSKNLDIGYLRAKDGVPLDSLSCKITFTANNEISADVTHSYTAK